MNRAERRRLSKKGITDKELKQIQDRQLEKAIRHTTLHYALAVSMVLRDKWGFGETRLKRILGQIDEQIDSIDKGYVSVADLQKTLLDECNIRIEL